MIGIPTILLLCINGQDLERIMICEAELHSNVWNFLERGNAGNAFSEVHSVCFTIRGVDSLMFYLQNSAGTYRK